MSKMIDHIIEVRSKLNIADKISIYRIISAPVMLVFMLKGDKNIFAWLLFISLASDIVDGFLARLLKITSNRGAQLDTIGDLITFAVGIGGMFKFENEFLLQQYKLIAVALIPYFLCVALALIRYGKLTSFHTYLAKIAAVLQGFFFIYLFFWGLDYLFFLITLIISSLVSVEEFCLILILPLWRANVKGFYWIWKEQRTTVPVNNK